MDKINVSVEFKPVFFEIILHSQVIVNGKNKRTDKTHVLNIDYDGFIEIINSCSNEK